MLKTTLFESAMMNDADIPVSNLLANILQISCIAIPYTLSNEIIYHVIIC